jgi:hypothetical protein
MTEKTTAVKSSEPVAEPGVVGISPLVLRELPTKANPSIVARIKEHLARKGG